MRKVYTIMFGVSITLTVAALLTIAVLGLNLGVDFKGGSVMEWQFKEKAPSIADIQKELAPKLTGKELAVAAEGDRNIIIKTSELSEADHQVVLGVAKDKFSSLGVEEKSFDSIGPVVGKELKDKSITAIILVLLGIMIYIAGVFRKLSRALSSWVMGLSAIIALIHDVSIPVGIFSLLGHFYHIEISAVFVAAVLTILGYSVSDTVVVFDRVRENIIRGGLKEQFAEVVHKSIMQTLARSINTNITVLLSLIAIYFFGGESIKYFSLALIIGIFLGAYSSIFVASPILVWFNKRGRR